MLITKLKIFIVPLILLTFVACSFNKKEFVNNADGLSFERTGEDTARIWFAPFIDQAGNQHEASYINIVTRSSSWTEVKETAFKEGAND